MGAAIEIPDNASEANHGLRSILMCNYCNVFEPVPIPVRAGLLCHMVNKFAEAHKDCKNHVSGKPAAH
jgi:hypothetical protein